MGAIEQATEGSFRLEELSVRRCRRCSREWPGYLDVCRACAAALGEPVAREIVIVAPPHSGADLPGRFVPVAAVALELSGNPPPSERLLLDAKEQTEPLRRAAACSVLPSGVFVALFTGSSLHAAAASAAEATTAIAPSRNLEARLAIALGLVDGEAPWSSAVVADAERLARAAQAGQTLATHAVGLELAATWVLGPVGVQPRRREDAAEGIALHGRRRRADTPSALAPDDGYVLVGRDRELELLDAELEQVRSGRARWCALLAPAGGGKSKLLRTWLSRIDRGSLVVAGAAASPFGAAPLSLAADLCEALDRPFPSELPTDVLPWLRGALGDASAERPVVVVVDDLHWADEASHATLRRLAEHELRGCLVLVALRTSFAPSARWLLERARKIELPGLDPAERDQLVRRLLPGSAQERVRRSLVESPAGANPLYLEHAAAYVRERGRNEELPGSLHQAVLRRLDLLRSTLHRRGFGPPSAADLAQVEAQIGEWLDRLETGDYESRVSIAEYLAMLEGIDLDLIVASSLAGRPLERNRRLTAAIERFYSAGFSERVEAIERLARHNRGAAVHAAGRGASLSVSSLRFDDAEAYLALASRLAEGRDRTRDLLALGDVRLTAGSAGGAWRAYVEARRGADPELRALCARRLARAALARRRLRVAEGLLESARRTPPRTDESAGVSCDLAVVRALLGRGSPRTLLDEAEGQATTSQERRLLLRARLRVELAAGRPATALAAACAGSLSLPADLAAGLAEIVETTALLLRVRPAHVDETVLDEARRAARRLGNPAATAKLDGVETGWQPIHPLV